MPKPDQPITNPVILITGACGQLGTELTSALRQHYGKTQIIASDIQDKTPRLSAQGTYIRLDASDPQALEKAIDQYHVTQIYHLAAILSANGEKNPIAAWDLNMRSLLNVLEAARIFKLERVFWPSSIAVFGPDAPKINCNQSAATNPTTVYGISKLAGEQWCNYYREQYQLDIRSIRYPGLISHSAAAGGGTTDYAVAIFHEAIKNGSYTCYLKENTRLPMLYMDDAVRGTIELMQAPQKTLRSKCSYNLAGLSFTPAEIAAEIQKHIPGFSIEYQPDHRQQIADSWPRSIADDAARGDWGWRSQDQLQSLCEDMIRQLSTHYQHPKDQKETKPMPENK